jgi:hypothetical protein
VDAGPTAATDSFTQMMKAWTEAFTRFSGERANSRSPMTDVGDGGDPDAAGGDGPPTARTARLNVCLTLQRDGIRSYLPAGPPVATPPTTPKARPRTSSTWLMTIGPRCRRRPVTVPKPTASDGTLLA